MNSCLHGKTVSEIVCEMNVAGQIGSERCREFISKRGPLGPVHVKSIGHEEKMSGNLRLGPITSCDESKEPSQGHKRRHHTRRSDQKSTRMLKLPKTTNQIHVIANMTLLLMAGALIKSAAGHSQQLASDSINFHDGHRPGGGSSYSMLSAGTNTENSAGDGKSSELNEENEDELDFKLMNAAHDRLQAVRNLLNATRQQIISSSNDADDQSLQGRASSATGSSLHCAHKGRHYANGQMVPIEDQPCLNCTCRTAVLQCYLRVCPPIVSLEAHRQRLIASGRALAGDQDCRMLRTPGECCPSMRCGDELLALGTATTTTTANEPEARNVVGASSAQQFQTANDHHHLVAAGSSKSSHQQTADQSRGGDQLQSASSIVQTTTTTIMPFDNLPKLTVINGPAGQRDSILLITSNPQAISLNGSSIAGRFSSNSNDSSPVAMGDNGEHQRQLVSSAPIIEALLETIYSSAAKQLSGLNLQGSCMINGSLYFEGSAVLPESGNGQCQYCYCIRQKVMCVRPRCHLIISGCTPKYNNEFACCPTSYNCQQNSLGRGDSTAPLNGTALARLTSLSGAPSSSELLQARLSAVLEAALARVTRDQRYGPGEQPLKLLNSAAGDLDLNEPLTARQIDGGQQVAVGKQERNNLLDLFSILDDRQTEPAPSQPSTTTSSTTTTTTARPITTTSSTTTTLAPTTSTTTTSTTTTSTTAAPPGRSAHSQPVRDTTKAEEDEEEELDKSKEQVSSTTTTTTSRPTETRKKTTSSQAEERRATSVSNFLEPMNKLGPLMNTPTIPSGCVENGRSYAIGEQIPTIEACKHCYCGPEGLKECKMVECEVKGDHDCRPVTQAGHCCPIRYECPPTSNSKSNFDSSQLTQCNSSTGLDNNCRHNETAAPVLKSTRLVDEPQEELPTPPSANTFNGILEPVGPTADPTQQLQQLNGSMSSLTDELNQFIMRIRANQSNSSDGAAPSGGPVEPDPNSEPNNGFNGTRATTTKQDYESVRPPEKTITTPSSPSLTNDPLTIPAGMLGIPSIEPETIESLSRNFSNHLEPTLNPFDLTSTPPSTMANQAQYGNEPTINVINDHNSANQRDMRPTNGRMLGGNSSGQFLGTILDPSQTPQTFSIVSNPSSTPFTAPIEYSTQPVAGNGNVAADLGQGNQLFGRPVMRVANLQASNQPEVMGHTRNLRDETSGTRSRKPVEFDDDAILSLINNHHSNTANGHQVAPLGPGLVPNDQSNNTNYALYAANGDSADGVTPEPELGRPTTGTPIGLEAERGLSLGSSWLRLLPQWTRTFGQRLSGFDGFQSAANGQHQDVMTLVAQNQSQADASDQAGGDQSAVASARSNRQNPFMSMLVSIINSNDEQQKQLQAQALQPVRSQPTPARAANLIMRPLDQAQLMPINRSVEQKQADSRQTLTPIVSSFQPSQQQPRTKPFSSPYEPTVGYSEPEIITAPAPHDEPGRFDPTATADADTKELVVVASSSFARRSDVPVEGGGGEDETLAQDADKTPIVTGHKASDEVRYHSSLSSQVPAANLNGAVESSLTPVIEATTSSQPNQGHHHQEEHTTPLAIGQPAKQPALSCYDVATNRTYQLNERIPKADGPCKVCHCILGREICQPHVCPPRPSERCREEHRPGECCPDWLCGDGLTPVSNLGGDLPNNQHADLREPGPMSPQVANNSQLQPSQRSLGASQEQNMNAPKLSRQLGAGHERQQANLLMRNPTNNVNFLSALNSRQLSSNAVQQNQGQQHLFVPNQAQINQFRQLQQPQPTSNNQFSQSNQRAEQRTGVQAPSLQPHQYQTNLRSSILPGSSFIGSPILMHPQQFIRQQQHQQQQQNLLRRNDDSGPSQMFNSNPSPFSMRPAATDYQAQNNQANAMRFPPATHNAADHRVGSQQPLLAPRPIQQQMFPSMEQNANNNSPNSQLSLPINQQVSPPAISGQFLPTALRTVPLFTTSQPRPGPMYSSQLVPIPSAGPKNSMAEQAKAVAHSNGLREVTNSSPQPADKVLFKQSQMTPVLDSAGFRPIVRPAQSFTFGSADQSTDYSNHVADNSVLAPARFIEKDSSSRTEPTSTRTSVSTTDESVSTSATISQTPAMSFSRQLPTSTDSSGSSSTHTEATTTTTTHSSASSISPADETLAVTAATSSDQDESLPTETSSSRPDSSSMTGISQTDATSTSTFSSPTTTTTTKTTMSPTSTTTLNSIDYFDSEGPSGDSGGSGDSLDSVLTFSECNIKGKVYKLGQPIEEESSSCRRCTCTSTGVVCKIEC